MSIPALGMGMSLLNTLLAPHPLANPLLKSPLLNTAATVAKPLVGAFANNFGQGFQSIAKPMAFGMGQAAADGLGGLLGKACQSACSFALGQGSKSCRF